jgi:hypothetical protein
VFDRVGDDAGVVLATALSIKMAGFILGGPLVAAVADSAPRHGLIAGLSAVRAASVAAMPFVWSVGGLYALVAVFALASAALTAIYQESVAVLLPDEPDYSWALVKSRAAYALEGVAGPVAATPPLLLVDQSGLFVAATSRPG